MKNPKWHRDEIILVLDLYYKFKSVRKNATPKSLQVINISEILNLIPLNAEDAQNYNYRNENGVCMKIANLKSIDPDHNGDGLKSASKLDEEVFYEFYGERSLLEETARNIVSKARKNSVARRDPDISLDIDLNLDFVIDKKKHFNEKGILIEENNSKSPVNESEPGSSFKAFLKKRRIGNDKINKNSEQGKNTKTQLSGKSKNEVIKNDEFLTYEKARTYVRSLKLGSYQTLIKWNKSKKRPKNIPENPKSHYRDKGWYSFGDYVGYYSKTNPKPDSTLVDSSMVKPTPGNKIKFKYLQYWAAKKYIHSLNFKDLDEFKNWLNSDQRTSVIPQYPSNEYRDKGWVSLYEFVGIARESEIDSVAEINKNFPNKKSVTWPEINRSAPDYIQTPEKIIKTKKVKEFKYLNFEDARKYVRSLNFKNYEEFQEWTKLDRAHPSVPKMPYLDYKNQGWISINDWLRKQVKGVKTIESEKVNKETYETADKDFIDAILKFDDTTEIKKKTKYIVSGGWLGQRFGFADISYLKLKNLQDFKCLSCSKTKTSRSIAIVNNDWSKIICNSCFGFRCRIHLKKKY